MNSESKIISEDPKHHWGFLQCKNEVVLDLGCAYNDIDEERTRENNLGTPQFIINQHPRKYIGVDINTADLDTFRSLYMGVDSVDFIYKKIETTECIQTLLDKYIPTIIKSDIEGAEIHFCGVSLPRETKTIAVETHSLEIESSFIGWVKKYDFSIHSIQSLASHPHIKVIHFVR